MKIRGFLMLMFAVVALASPVVANDTEAGFTAGQPYPVKSATLRLVSENLQVDLEPGDATVEVIFELKNEGAARDVVLGFPYFAKADKRYEDQNYAGDLQDFQCKIDGKPAALSQSRGKSIDKDFKSTSWYTWTVHFDAGQTRKVWHRFRGRLGTSVAAQLPDGKDAAVSTFYYILTTARNWKAPIGDFHLTIRPKAPLALSDIYAVSLPMRVEGGVLEADRKNFVPSQELRIQTFAKFLRDPLAWTNPDFKVRARRLYSAYPPDSTLAKSLRLVVATRYKVGAKGMEDYNIVPYKDKYFAATRAGNRYAIWECVGGRWTFVFQHDELTPAAADPVYGKNGFSPTMRSRLLGGTWDTWLGP